MSLLLRVNEFPPHLCRFLARKARGRRPMTNTDIARAAMLSRARVAELSQMESWADVTVAEAVRFSLACGVNLLAPCKSRRFILRRLAVYQRNASPAQRRMYNRIVEQLRRKRMEAV